MKKYPLEKGTFVNMEDGVDEQIQKHDFVDYKSTDTWKDLHCQGVRVGPFTVKTECRTPDGKSEYEPSDPSRHKIFVKLKSCRLKNLSDYIRLLQNGIIHKKDHDSLFRFLETQKLKVQSGTDEKVIAFNHNMDVGVLHFKFKCNADYKCRNVSH